jgi:cyanate permease
VGRGTFFQPAIGVQVQAPRYRLGWTRAILVWSAPSTVLMLLVPHDHAHPRLHHPERVEPQSVWRSAVTFFECECGRLLTLADREDEARTGKGRMVGRPR